jgi:hypothetical protein
MYRGGVPPQLGASSLPVHARQVTDATMGTVMPDPPEPDEVQCSAKGCRNDAVHLLVWNNPKLHTPGREKTWVACADHRESLSEFLQLRGFLRRVDPLS